MIFRAGLIDIPKIYAHSERLVFLWHQDDIGFSGTGQTQAWENTQSPLQATKVSAIKIQRNQPNYLAAQTTVMRLRLTDPLSGTTQTIAYRTPTAVSLAGPLQWATSSVTPQRLNIQLAFAD